MPCNCWECAKLSDDPCLDVPFFRTAKHVPDADREGYLTKGRASSRKRELALERFPTSCLTPWTPTGRQLAKEVGKATRVCVRVDLAAYLQRSSAQLNNEVIRPRR